MNVLKYKKLNRSLAVMLCISLMNGAVPFETISYAAGSVSVSGGDAIASEEFEITTAEGEDNEGNEGEGAGENTEQEGSETDKNVITDVSVSGVTVKYDGTDHAAVEVDGTLETDTVIYKLGEGEEQNEVPTINEVGTYSVTVKVIREEYEVYTTTVNSVVELGELEITAEAYTGAYDGEEHLAASVNGLQEGDTVTYQLGDGEVQETMPVIKEVAEYTLTITVERENYEKKIITVNPNITKNTIVIQVKKYEGEYDGASHPALEIVDGLMDNDNITYKLNDGEVQNTVPEIKNVGNYRVTVYIERHGYELYENEFSDILIKATDISGFNVIPYSGEYDANTHEAVTVELLEEGDTIEYQLNGGAWTTEVPLIVDAGTYEVKVRVSRKNYNTTEALPVYATIQQAAQELRFEKYDIGGTTNISLGETDSVSFRAIDVNQYAGGNITYEIVLSESEDIIDDVNKIASIDSSTGELTINGVGRIVVKATLAGNNNYKECEIVHNVNISVQPSFPGEFVEFETEGDVEYILGQNNGVVSDLIAEPTQEGDASEIVYSISDTEIGLSCNAENGTITVTNGDYTVLGNALLQSGGKLEVVVTAKKMAGVLYGEDSTSYKATIKFMSPVEDAYTVVGEKGTIGETETDWYVQPITVNVASGYEIAGTTNQEEFVTSFSASASFDNQDPEKRYVYIRDKASGGITGQIPLDVHIDTEAPSGLNISFADVNLVEKWLAETFEFYNPDVKVTFKAKDISSGIHHFEWWYTREPEASTSISEKITGEPLQVAGYDAEGNAYAEVTLPLQQANELRGNISCKVYDNAGNSSECENDTILVVDTISPTMNATHYLKDETKVYNPQAGQHYYSGDVVFKFTFNEANFFPKDVKIKVSKDGKEAELVNNVEWMPVEDAVDVYEGSFTLTGDGDYVVYMEYGFKTENNVEKVTYTDNSGNPLKDLEGNIIQAYRSETITIDTTKPVVKFAYDEKSQKAIFKVTERNFKKTDISVDVQAKDIKGNAVKAKDLETLLRTATWKQDATNKDTYIYETKEFISGIYSLQIDYKDVVQQTAATCNTGSFTVDHDAPVIEAIQYSTPLEKILNALGFYKDNVTITFTAQDATSEIKNFNWSYIRQKDASSKNRDTDTEEQIAQQLLTNVVQSKTDKSKFTATLTLPQSQAEQLRGNIAVVATDQYGNKSEKKTDKGYVVVVDTVSPNFTVEYNSPDRSDENGIYYKKNVEITFAVTESNFYAEDVYISVTKDKTKTYPITPVWSCVGEDQYIGTYTLTEDGDYEIHVEYDDYSHNKMIYTDSSGNVMNSYTSPMITIDTIVPVVEVVYQNSGVVNAQTDQSGNARKYFAGTQTAVLKVTEHNFDAAGVELQVDAKDVAGQGLNANSLYNESGWSSDGDVHTKTITFPGNANYSFDVTCVDYALNNAADYAMNYFTVDTIAPENLTVNYSTGILEEVLEAITFGFYNAKVTVTLTADDTVSGINSFVYSYLKGENVSAVNGELVDQTIPSGDIKYTNGGRTATVSFEIPKDALGNNSQFNGTIEFTAVDRSGKETAYKDGKRLVVDNIAPTAEITYSAPVAVDEERGISYYAGDIEAELTINEANFYGQDVEVRVSRDGGEAYAVTPTWTNNSVDEHVGRFTLTENGDYFITVDYVDKSSNQMETYTSTQLTIDKQIDEQPEITINGKAIQDKPYAEAVVLKISYNDRNFAKCDVKLEKTSMEAQGADVTGEYIKDYIVENSQGGEGTIDTFAIAPENDGIYKLTVVMEDKALHVSETEPVYFTVNRYGSVYEYDEYLEKVMENGGYKKEITSDLIITEYNPSKLVEGSLNVEVTLDGKPIEGVTPKVSEKAGDFETGWFQYEYAISKDYFAADGVYKVAVSSKDAADNMPENGNYEGKDIAFMVDSTAPEITSIVGLEENIIDATEQTVRYTVFDAIGLASVEVTIDGQREGELITDFSKDLNNYTGEFTLDESVDPQKVRIVVKDLADNTTDTDAKDFKCAYEFNPTVTVSTNFLVRWYANKPLFWGTIGGAVAVIGLIGGMVAIKRKKRLK